MRILKLGSYERIKAPITKRKLAPMYSGRGIYHDLNDETRDRILLDQWEKAVKEWRHD